MEDLLLDCKDELKRAEHLIFVSMKYSRTVDVIRAAISRLISSYELMIDALLKYKIDSGEKIELPKIYGLKTQLVRKYFQNDERVIKELNFYFFLKKIMRSEFQSDKEYRRHVNMTVVVDGEEKKITYDDILEFYKKAMDFFHYLVKTYLNKECINDS